MGSLSYGDDNLVEYKLTVTYDYANFSSKPEAAETSSPQPIYDDIIREERNAKIEAFRELQKKKKPMPSELMIFLAVSPALTQRQLKIR